MDSKRWALLHHRREADASLFRTELLCVNTLPCLHQFSQTEIKLDVDFAAVFLSKMSDFEVRAEATELDVV